MDINVPNQKPNCRVACDVIILFYFYYRGLMDPWGQEVNQVNP